MCIHCCFTFVFDISLNICALEEVSCQHFSFRKLLTRRSFCRKRVALNCDFRLRIYNRKEWLTLDSVANVLSQIRFPFAGYQKLPSKRSALIRNIFTFARIFLWRGCVSFECGIFEVTSYGGGGGLLRTLGGGRLGVSSTEITTIGSQSRVG